MCNARKHEARGARSLCFSLFLLTAVSSLAHAAEMEVREVSLVNPGFESSVLHEGWSLHVYGAPPTLAQDAAVRHEGRMSVFRKRRRSLSERRRSRSGVKKSPNRWCPVSWADHAYINLWTESSLSTSPFRTDNWPM